MHQTSRTKISALLWCAALVALPQLGCKGEVGGASRRGRSSATAEAALPEVYQLEFLDFELAECADPGPGAIPRCLAGTPRIKAYAGLRHQCPWLLPLGNGSPSIVGRSGCFGAPAAAPAVAAGSADGETPAPAAETCDRGAPARLYVYALDQLTDAERGLCLQARVQGLVLPSTARLTLAADAVRAGEPIEIAEQLTVDDARYFSSFRIRFVPYAAGHGYGGCVAGAAGGALRAADPDGVCVASAGAGHYCAEQVELSLDGKRLEHRGTCVSCAAAAADPARCVDDTDAAEVDDTAGAEVDETAGAEADLPALELGDQGFCTEDARCEQGQGGCSDDGQCGSGLICSRTAEAHPINGKETAVRFCRAPVTDGERLCEERQRAGGDPCGMAEGGCEEHAHCGEDLVCTAAGELDDAGLRFCRPAVPGSPTFCEDKVNATRHLDNPIKCGEGQGGCADDADCEGDLTCSEASDTATFSVDFGPVRYCRGPDTDISLYVTAPAEPDAGDEPPDVLEEPDPGGGGEQSPDEPELDPTAGLPEPTSASALECGYPVEDGLEWWRCIDDPQLGGPALQVCRGGAERPCLGQGCRFFSVKAAPSCEGWPALGRYVATTQSATQAGGCAVGGRADRGLPLGLLLLAVLLGRRRSR